MKEKLQTMGRGSDKFSELEEEMQGDVDPDKMLRLLFKLINFKQANVDIYFLLHRSEKPLTVNEVCSELEYSERTIRTYLGVLADKGYIKKFPTIRDRPCFAYKAITPREVWELMLEEMRNIKRQAVKTFGTA